MDAMHRRQPQQLNKLDVNQVKNGYNIFIWASLLCTAWTTWQYVKKRNENIDQKPVNDVRSHNMKNMEKAEKLEEREKTVKKKMLVDDEKMEETRPVANGQCIL
eukprot:6127224-Heterocapsa_arctica.AAC.1